MSAPSTATPPAASTRWRRLGWALLPALLVVGLALAGVPERSPDGVEMAAAGRCLWRLPIDRAACVGLEPSFWAPVFPLLSGALALVLDPALAALLVGVAGFALLGRPLARLGGAVGGPLAAALAPLVVLVVPALRDHARMGEARGLALALLLAAGARLCHDERAALLDRGGLMRVGLLLGLAALTREEALAPALLLAGLAVARFGWRGGAVGGVLAGVMAPWVAFLSVRAGHLVPSPRSWQGAANRWVEALPPEWVFMELSAGSRGTPLRAMLSRSGAPGPGLSLDGLGGWMAIAVPAAVPLGLAALAMVGLVLSWRRARAPLLVLSAVVAPYLALQALPPARDAVVPANNLLVLPLGLGVLAAAALAAGLGRLPRRIAVGGILAAWAGVALSVGVEGAFARARPEPQAFDAAAAWLAAETRPDETIAASIVGAPAVLRADRTRRRLPPPHALRQALAGWERPDLALVTTHDLPAGRLVVRGLMDAGARPVARLVHGGDAVMVYRLPPR